ncbi:hypothetical protein MFFC18_27130 [Mariniblastus fucicola]|uniref:DUF423 domain-containing protein n=1 Tax=Mariniblastus fucicola TaxID=980251 RepID=A0A5B9P949_9BACT|nr:hypothetical protein MFFC18_27130 [Mariniblastus fucicola]
MGCLLAAISVACGAIGAHLLENWLAENFEDAIRRQELWETASRYLMYHALGLLAVGLAGSISSFRRNVIGATMLLGVILFSGCLYAYVLTDVKPLVHVVPLGGMSMIVSWVMFAWFMFFSQTNDAGA